MNLIRGFLLSVVLFLAWMFPWCASAEMDVYKGQALGDFSVYAIWSSKVNFPASLFFRADAPEQKIAVENPVRASVNVFLFESKDGIVMIDAGDAPLQHHFENLSIKQSDISHIMLTHIHPDHIGSLLGEDGKAAYDKANLYLSALEANAMLQAKKKLRDAWESIRRAYKGRIHTFSFDGNESLPGELAAIAAPGHTPGHTVYVKTLKKSEQQAYFNKNGEVEESTVTMEQRVYFVGDIVHAAPLQIADVGISCKFDADPVQAAQSRKKILAQIARGTVVRLPVGNMAVKSIICSAHAAFPGMGTVLSNKNTFIYVGDEL